MDSPASTIWNCQLKLCKNQMTTVERKIMVPAFFTKALARSHMWMRRPLMVGRW